MPDIPHVQSYILILFFAYCAVGWVWECLYVSAHEHRWVNRGFLYGPWLPIYGSGAILILFATAWCEQNLWLVYLFGMLAATILEYCTGAAMEKIFHVRYWDYSKNRFNLHGHICLFCSLGWGLFSVLLVRFINPVFVKAILLIPDAAAQPVSLILTILFVIDFTKSIQDALDMKALLTQMYENSETIAKIKERLQKSNERRSAGVEQLHRRLRNARSILRRNPTETSSSQEHTLSELIDIRLTEWKKKRKP